MIKISRSVSFVKQVKKMLTVQSVQCHVAADCTDMTIRSVQLMWQGIVGDDVGKYSWMSQGVTRVTIARVTCGTFVWLTWQV
jgi:hypothetical protein